MYDTKSLNERYTHDPMFCSAVEAMYNMIVQHGIGLEELRQAAFYATFKYQMSHSSDLVIDGKRYRFVRVDE